MNSLKKIGKRFLQLFVAIFLIVNLFIVLSGRFYLYKGVYYTYLHGRTGPSIYDQSIFHSSTIKHASSVFRFQEAIENNKLEQTDWKKMLSLKTASFIVIKNDSIVIEKYANGHNRSTVSNSFSAAKTVVALLIGTCIKNKTIKSLDDKVGNYIPSFKNGAKEHITIRHLLMMSSGLDWEESGKNPLSENAESYYGEDLKGIINRQQAIEKPGKKLNYQSGNSQVLGYIVEKASGMKLSEYAEHVLWSKIGTEHDAYWSLDKKNGDEKSFCCLYATSRDFARLGKLILQNGKWNDEEIIPSSYMQEMFKNPKLSTEEQVPNYRYGLHIWTYLGDQSPIYYCRGILGQYIIVIPKENIIIVRTGEEREKNITKNQNVFKIGHPKDLFLYISAAKKAL